MSLGEQVRRCPKCKQPEMRATHITQHVRRGRGDTVGYSGVFTCAACGETVTVMDPGLAFVLGFATLLGGAFAAYMAVAGSQMLDSYGDGVYLGIGFLVCGGGMLLGVGWSGWMLVKMLGGQVRSPLVHRPRPVAPSPAAPEPAPRAPARPPEPEREPDELDLEIRALERQRRMKVALIITVVVLIAIAPCAMIGVLLAQ